MRKVFCLILLFAIVFVAAAMGEELPDYGEFLSLYAENPRPEETFVVDMSDYTAIDVGVTETEICGETAIKWNSAYGSVTFKVSAPEAGLYSMFVRYAQLDGSSGQIERGVMVNGAYQYEESRNFYFPKRFSDNCYPFEKNEYGNEIRPRQEGVLTPSGIYLRDRNEFYAEPLLFFLNEGDNELTFVGVKGSIALIDIEFGPYAAKEEVFFADETAEDLPLITVEAEKIAARSNKGIQNMTVSEPGITPSEAGYKMLNCIGGSNWDDAGDFIEWDFEVASAGYYHFVFDYKQNFNTAMTSYRRLEVDGEVPAKAFETVAFPYSNSWTQTSAADGEEGVYVYLEKGTHTLRLTCVNEPYRELYGRLDAVVKEMKELDLYLKEIIGSDVDVYRVWRLDKYIPTIGADLTRLCNEVKDISAELGVLLGNTENLGTLTAAIEDLEDLAEDFNDIAKKADALSLVYTVFSNWQEYMLSQPVLMDKWYAVPIGQTAPEAGAGFWERLSFGAKSFFRSFINGGEEMLHEDEEAVTVWVQRNRDYVDMMQLLADEYYTKETGIKVNVTYCPPGSQLLVLANASGKQPDIVTGVDIALPFDFGIRNALVDLSTMEGFDEVVSHVAKGSRIPYYFSGAEYGIAETVNVNIMYYRTDVLDRLDIEVPETWDDAVNALSTLLQNNYAIYYPYGDYLTFFFQRDVDVYTDDCRSLAFTDEKGMSAFKQWVELYIKYGLQPAMSSFYQHFRIGDVPLGLNGLDQYIQFDLAAPDISGSWSVAPVPGTYDENGTLKRWQAGTQTGAIMFKTQEAREQRAWDFLRWWLDTETQCLYADYMENYYGEEFRWLSANPEVVSREAWPDAAKQTILEQLSWYKQLPMVPGGSYMTSRELWNAWTRIVVDHGNYREEIEAAVEDIELEIGIKQEELGYIDENGDSLIDMSLMRMDEPDERWEEP